MSIILTTYVETYWICIRIVKLLTYSHNELVMIKKTNEF